MARELTDQEKTIITEARDKFGAVGIYLPGDQLVVVRQATAGEYSRWHDKQSRLFGQSLQRKGGGGSGSLSDVQRELALSCMVHPGDIAARRAILDARPALASVFCTKATELAGDDVEEIEGN